MTDFIADQSETPPKVEIKTHRQLPVLDLTGKEYAVIEIGDNNPITSFVGHLEQAIAAYQKSNQQGPIEVENWLTQTHYPVSVAITKSGEPIKELQEPHRQIILPAHYEGSALKALMIDPTIPKDKTSEHGMFKVDFIRGIAGEELKKLPDESTGLMVAVNLFSSANSSRDAQFIKNLSSALNQAHRVLQPKGKIIFIETYTPDFRSPFELTKELYQAQLVPTVFIDEKSAIKVPPEETACRLSFQEMQAILLGAHGQDPQIKTFWHEYVVAAEKL